MTVLLLSADLTCLSQVAGAAQRTGLAFESLAQADALIERVAANGQTLVVLDLTVPGLDPAALLPRLRAAATPPRAILAFGPHVHESRLAAAVAAGCDEVFPRGQFYAQADAILRKHAAS